MPQDFDATITILSLFSTYLLNTQTLFAAPAMAQQPPEPFASQKALKPYGFPNAPKHQWWS
jgi:hypothetical protein